MRRAWAAFQRTGGSKRVRMLVSFCVVHMTDAMSEAEAAIAPISSTAMTDEAASAYQ